ncbi:MAG: transporter [Cyanobacteria bacterium RYN_339]|nr:transporter [Cyanobacteria bacterium RYN_339]
MSGGGWHVLSYGQKAEKTTITREQFGRILGYFRPYWREAVFVLFVISCAAMLGLAPPLLLRMLLDQAIPLKDWHLLHMLCAAMMALPVVTGLLGVLETYLDERISQGVMLDLRVEIFRKLQAQSMEYFTTNRPGDISSRLNNDVNDLADIFSDTVVAITSNVLILVSTVAIIFTLDWHLAMLAIAIVPLFIPPAWWVGKLRQEIVKQAQEKRSDLHSLVQDTMSINGFLIRRIFGHLPEERARYAKAGREFGQIQMRRSLIWRWFALTLSLVGILGPTAIYWYGGDLAIRGVVTIGTIVAFVAYLGRLYGPMSALATIHVQVLSSFAVFERLFQVLDAVPTVRDQEAVKELPPVSGHLTFEHVGFRYREDRALLEDVSFEVKPGQFVALVGPSGAGKTSLTYLIPRFYDPTSGVIRLDGQDLKEVSLESLQAQVAMVTQEPFLFHTSLRENLLIAKPDATPEELESACKSAYIHDAIVSLPEGYDTVVGERGYRLSGGERQRLALARVILKGPRVLILDEATSSLDSQSEALIQQALAPLMQGRTTIAIAHRLSTILHADLILVLEAGRVVERGQHAELLAAGGLYARLYEEQFKGDSRTNET